MVRLKKLEKARYQHVLEEDWTIHGHMSKYILQGMKKVKRRNHARQISIVRSYNRPTDLWTKGRLHQKVKRKRIKAAYKATPV